MQTGNFGLIELGNKLAGDQNQQRRLFGYAMHRPSAVEFALYKAAQRLELARRQQGKDMPDDQFKALAPAYLEHILSPSLKTYEGVAAVTRDDSVLRALFPESLIYKRTQGAGELSNGDVLSIIREFQGHEIDDEQGKSLLPNTGFEMAAYHNAAEGYAKAITANRSVPRDVMAVIRRVPEGDGPLMHHLKEIIVAQITGELKKGTIIKRPIPKWLQDAFENPAERVLRPLVTEGQLDRSVLEHVKTRAPWVVKGSTVHNQTILNMADEYDVFDQARLIAYQNGSQVKPFVVVPIDLIRNNRTQLTDANKVVIKSIFAANPEATLVVDYGDAEVADGLNDSSLIADQKSLPNSVHHISFVGENVTSIGDHFLNDCRSLTSVDLSGFRNVIVIGRSFIGRCHYLTSVDLSSLSNVTRIGNFFLSGCSRLTSVDLSSLSQLTSIGDSFLNECIDVSSVDLSGLARLKSIGRFFLSACYRLTSIDLRNVAEPGHSVIRDKLQSGYWKGTIVE